MKAAVLFSGGKDSNLALLRAVDSGIIVECLVCIKPEADDSYMFHKPCIELATLQAARMGYPVVSATVSGVKEEEVRELKDVFGPLEIDAVVSGAVESNYQKSRIGEVACELGLKSINPLWRIDPMALLSELLDKGFKTMVVGVAAEGLGEEWLGRILDDDAVQELYELNRRYGIHPAGEGGEYETFVLDGPLYSQGIRVVGYDVVWEGISGYVSNMSVV
jgi:diphthine-ammonia ligase